MSESDKKFLIHLHLEGMKQTESMGSDCFVIGKSKKADLSLPLEGLSRQHLKVSFKDGEIWLEDLGSTFGTFVNKIKLSPSKPFLYNPNDRIRIGVAESEMTIEYIGELKNSMNSEVRTEVFSLGQQEVDEARSIPTPLGQDMTAPLVFNDSGNFKQDLPDETSESEFNMGGDFENTEHRVVSLEADDLAETTQEVGESEQNLEYSSADRNAPKLNLVSSKKEEDKEDQEEFRVEENFDLAQQEKSYKRSDLPPPLSVRRPATHREESVVTHAVAPSEDGNAAVKVQPGLSFDQTVDLFKKSQKDQIISESKSANSYDENSPDEVESDQDLEFNDGEEKHHPLSGMSPLGGNLLIDEETEPDLEADEVKKIRSSESFDSDSEQDRRSSNFEELKALAEEPRDISQDDTVIMDPEEMKSIVRNSTQTSTMKVSGITQSYNGNEENADKTDEDLVGELPKEVIERLERNRKSPDIFGKLKKIARKNSDVEVLTGRSQISHKSGPKATRWAAAVTSQNTASSSLRQNDMEITETQLQLAILKQEVAEIELDEFKILVREKLIDLKRIIDENNIQEKKIIEINQLISQKNIVLDQQKEEIVSLDEEIKDLQLKLDVEKKKVATAIRNFDGEKKKIDQEVQQYQANFEKEREELKSEIHKIELQIAEVEGHLEDAKRVHQETLSSTRKLVESAEEDVKEYRLEKEQLGIRLDEVEDELNRKNTQLKTVEMAVQAKFSEAELLETDFEEKCEEIEKALKEAEGKLHARKNEIETEIIDLEREFERTKEDLRSKIDGIQDSKSKITDEYEQWCKDIEDEEKNLRADVDSLISEKKKELSEFESGVRKKKSDLEEELQVLSSEVETKRKRKERIEREIELLLKEIDDLRGKEESRLAELQEEMDFIIEDLGKKKEEHVVFLSEYRALEKNKTDLEKACDDLRDKRRDLDSRIEELVLEYDKRKYELEREHEIRIREKSDEYKVKLKEFEEEAKSYKENLFADIERERKNAIKELEEARKKSDIYGDEIKKEADAYSLSVKSSADQYSKETRDEADKYRDLRLNEAQEEANKIVEESSSYSLRVKEDADMIKAHEQERQKALRSELDEKMNKARESFEESLRSERELWNEEKDRLKKGLENEIKLARLELEKEIEFERSKELDVIVQEKHELETAVSALKDQKEVSTLEFEKTVNQNSEQFESRRLAMELELKELKQKLEHETQRIEESLEAKRKAVEEQLRREEQSLNKSFQERKQKEEKAFAETKLAQFEELRQELEDEKKKSIRERKVEIESITKNIQSALRSSSSSQFGAKEQDEFLREVEEVVEAVMGDDPDLKRNLVVKIDKNVKEKERRFWIRTGLQVFGAIAAISILIALPKGFFSAVGASVWAAISSDQSAAEIFAQRILDAQRNRPKFHPPKDLEFKKTYSDNVLYTENYFINKMDVGYQEAWTIALNSYVPDTLKLDEEIVPKVFSLESVMLGKLAEAYDRINPKFEKEGIERLRLVEEETLKELQSVLGPEKNFKKFKKFEREFYLKYFLEKKKSL